MGGENLKIAVDDFLSIFRTFSKILPADSLGLTIEDEDGKRFMERFKEGILPDLMLLCSDDEVSDPL